MKRKHFFMRTRMCSLALLGVGALFLASCAQDGFDNSETFTSDVTGVTLTSPAKEDITISASADGKKQTFSWPLVKGAGGFLISFFDTSKMDEPLVKDSVVDGNAVTLSREEDMNYLFTIKTLGNAKNNNTEAETTTEYSFSTFTPTYKTIPGGQNLNEWFAANPVPESTEFVNYDLEAGKEYTMSGLLEFGNTPVTIRCNSKTEWANIKFTGAEAGFSINAGFGLKYLNIDASASTAGFINMAKNPTVAPIVVNAWGADYNFYLIKDPVTIASCKIDGVNSYIFWDNSVQCWFPSAFSVDNTIIHLTTPADSKAVSGGYIWTNKGSGYIRNMAMTNTTIYNTGEGDVKYFVQYGGFGNDQTKDETSLGWSDNIITYDHCTFYHVCSSGQWGNYNGVAGKATSFWVMTNCIFYDCSSSGVARRFLAGKQNQATATFLNNTYMKKDGTFDNPESYDNTGTDIKEDPGFANADAADFHISGATQVARGTGDPRWLPAN